MQKAIERHRQTWQGKSDEWLFERLDNELKQKVEEIHRLLAEEKDYEQLKREVITIISDDGLITPNLTLDEYRYKLKLIIDVL